MRPIWFSFLWWLQPPNLLSWGSLLPLHSSSCCFLFQLPQIRNWEENLILHQRPHFFGRCPSSCHVWDCEELLSYWNIRPLLRLTNTLRPSSNVSASEPSAPDLPASVPHPSSWDAPSPAVLIPSGFFVFFSQNMFSESNAKLATSRSWRTFRLFFFRLWQFHY